MSRPHDRELHFLWHPGTRDVFSGYGLTVRPAHLVGVVMVDRPTVADPAWLAEIAETFGAYELVPMTESGERGIVCQMEIAIESMSYLKGFGHAPRARALFDALVPLMEHPPAVTLSLAWDGATRHWTSRIAGGAIKPYPRFPLGQVVATPRALRALQEAEQEPMEFMTRHVRGDWGELDDEDKQANERALREGLRILSVYHTSDGVRLYVITEWDRSVTTLLLPDEY